MRTGGTADGPQHRRELWRRRQLRPAHSRSPNGRRETSAFDDRATVAWRSAWSATSASPPSPSPTPQPRIRARRSRSPEDCLFQVRLQVDVTNGELHPYPTGNPVNASDEDLELELRYRDKATYAIGHGVAVDWQVGQPGPRRRGPIASRPKPFRPFAHASVRMPRSN